jgi:hypothetical protein
MKIPSFEETHKRKDLSEVVDVHSKGTVGISYNNAQMVLWDKSDYKTVNHFFDLCNQDTLKIAGYIEHLRPLKREFYRRKGLKLELDSFQMQELNWLEKRIKRYTHDLNEKIDKLESLVYNYKYSDKKNGFELLCCDKKVEPQTICIKENTLVNPALQVYAKLISNASVEEFRYIASGTSAVKTIPSQNELNNENSRLDIFLNGGFRNPHGDVVREGVVFPPGLDDALVKEFGSFSLPEHTEEDIMQWHNVIEDPSEQIDHDQGNTFYSVAHVTILQINYIE